MTTNHQFPPIRNVNSDPFERLLLGDPGVTPVLPRFVFVLDASD